MKECHYIRKSTFLCVMIFCASGLATSARLLISLEIEWFHLKPFDLGGLDSRDRMVSFETIRSQGVGGDPRQTPEIEWFQLKPFDLGCPKLDPQDRMVSIETIRYPWIFLKPFDLRVSGAGGGGRSNGFKNIQGYRMVSIETIRSGGSNFGHPRSNGFS